MNNDTDFHLRIYASDCDHTVIQNSFLGYTELIFPTYDDMVIFRGQLCRMIKLFEGYPRCISSLQEQESFELPF